MSTYTILDREKTDETYDVIVVGSGMTGGLAAKELCEAGYNVLVLERGRMVEHIKDYTTANTDPWDFPLRNLVSQAEEKTYHIQKELYLFGDDTKHFLVKDTEHPYVQNKPFSWFRGYHMGGRSLLWGKHCYRLGEADFKANKEEGIGEDWPIRYEDLAPWYDYVESYMGINGSNEGLPQIPDGKFQEPFELNAIEKHVKKCVEAKFEERNLIPGRLAVLTKEHNGRGKCQGRNLCHRGCVFGAAYSSNAASLPDAAKTGKLTIRPYSIVEMLTYDSTNKKVKGVRVIDAETNNRSEFYARVVFLNASTLGSTQILLQSKTEEFPNGLGNTSGVLGHYLMDHHGSVGAMGGSSKHKESYYKGQKPGASCIPRFRNLGEKKEAYSRGFFFECIVSKNDWTRAFNQPGIGAEWKDGLSKPGDWFVYLEGLGETLPEYENKVFLDEEKKDQWGLPLLNISMAYGENEVKMREDMRKTAKEMLEASEFDWVSDFDWGATPGTVIHEMGTARMGRDPKTSFLNEYNQSHEIPNLFVTDGACMPSSPCQNPSLTYMALTARACDFAVGEMKKGKL